MLTSSSPTSCEGEFVLVYPKSNYLVIDLQTSSFEDLVLTLADPLNFVEVKNSHVTIAEFFLSREFHDVSCRKDSYEGKEAPMSFCFIDDDIEITLERTFSEREVQPYPSYYVTKICFLKFLTSHVYSAHSKIPEGIRYQRNRHRYFKRVQKGIYVKAIEFKFNKEGLVQKVYQIDDYRENIPFRTHTIFVTTFLNTSLISVDFILEATNKSQVFTLSDLIKNIEMSTERLVTRLDKKGNPPFILESMFKCEEITLFEMSII